ncbi:P-loop containing nucleoside triphosphate hydrolase protein [Xylariaceae sp. FL0804]|nr:P-loop containing nucleoside triphosphate hydrolase protein [Xylariaceae sp. FL0804]
MSQLFRSGLGLGPGGLFRDPPAHGLALVRELVEHWISELNVTRLGALAACVGAAPPAWRFVRAAWRDAHGWVLHLFVSSVVVPARDPVNRNVMAWVLDHVIRHREGGIRTFTARTRAQQSQNAAGAGADGVGGVGDDRGAHLKKRRREVQYLPHFETAWFWHGGRPFVVSRSLARFVAAAADDPAYDGVGGEELTIGCLGRSTEPIRALVRRCQEYADRQAQYFVLIYARDRYGLSWQPRARRPLRRLETVHFDPGAKRALLQDVRKYLDPETRRRYQARGMPYRRGYLFHGPPGTGKSSLSTALAGEFGLDLYEVKIPSVATDGDLEQMFLEIPPQCICLLEDVDAIWQERGSSAAAAAAGGEENHQQQQQQQQQRQQQHAAPTTRSSCTLSGLLNVLDGVGSQEGRIVIMTTNKPERLDGALVRPGRVDMKVMLGNISRESAGQMFVRMFSPDVAAADDNDEEKPSRVDNDDSGGGPRDSPHLLTAQQLRELAAAFAAHVPEDTFTPSQLQGFFQLHLDDAHDAAASIAAWVENELSREGMVDDDIEIVGEGKSQ